MTKENSIYEPYIHPRLKKFFNEHIDIINIIFNILKKYKPKIVDSFSYSIKNPSLWDHSLNFFLRVSPFIKLL